MLFHYTPPEIDKDSFRIATCNDLIWLKSKHQEFFDKNSTDPYIKNKGLGWGLKALGYYYGLEYLKTVRPPRVLEIGAGFQMFFSDRCRELGLEYWMCDAETSLFSAVYSESGIKQRFANRPDGTFVYGLVGDYLDSLPANYFDLVLSISVAEHVPQEKLDDFYGDIMRVLKKQVTGESGRMIHTIDFPYIPEFELLLQHLRAGSSAGFTVPKSDFLGSKALPLFEPIEFQYVGYSGHNRNMWGEEMTPLDYRWGTAIFNSSPFKSG